MTRSDLEHIVSQGHSAFSPSPEGCSQLFANCSDPECERPCGARVIPAYNLDEQKLSTDRWELAIIAFAVVSLLVVFLIPVAVERFNAVQIATSEDVQ